MAGFLRYVSVQRYVIADYGGAPPPSYSQFFRSNFPGYPNGYTSGVPLSRPQFYPNGYGYTGGVPVRPQVWEEEDSSEEVELAAQDAKKGDSENNANALQKCCKFLTDGFHQFYDYFKQFLYYLERNLERFDEYLEHCLETMKEWEEQQKQEKIMREEQEKQERIRREEERIRREEQEKQERIRREERNKQANLMNNGTQAAGDSYHHYHYYNYNYNNSGCCPCIGFRRGGAPSPSNSGNHRREEVVANEVNNGTREGGDSYHYYNYNNYIYNNSGCCPCIGGGAPSPSNGGNHRPGEVVQKLCNPPRGQEELRQIELKQ